LGWWFFFDFLLSELGRIYDPLLATFLSPDPFVQTPDDGQNYNRYSYVLNNPLSMSDPSGHFFQLIVAAVVAIAAYSGASALTVAIIAGLLTFGGTLAMGGTLEQALFAGAIAFASAYGAHQIGSYFNKAYGGLEGFKSALANGQANWGIELARASTHGLYQGGLTELAGGEFKSGFLSAFTSSSAGSIMQFSGAGRDVFGTPGTDSYANAEYVTTRTVAAAVIGGAASELSGGKFANGAMTGAFTHLFGNEMARRARSGKKGFALKPGEGGTEEFSGQPTAVVDEANAVIFAGDFHTGTKTVPNMAVRNYWIASTYYELKAMGYDVVIDYSATGQEIANYKGQIQVPISSPNWKNRN
jgi:hypothetical protein